MIGKPLDGMVALVTGAGRGIGRAIALGFGDAGASVCCAARTQAQVDATAEAIRARNGRAMAHSVDVTDNSAVSGLVEATVKTFGRLDLLVVNAGVNSARGNVSDVDPDAWRTTIEVNLVGAYYCARAAVPALRRSGGGKIIMIGSGIGHRGTAGNSAYACSKAGLWMLTRVLAQELAGDRISVNELIPGPVDTGLLPTAPAGRAFMGDSEWLKQPEDVVPMALFLATQPAVGPTAQSFSLMRRDK
jgi:3-oxoacyl-[acyl-carrier protein] reductase